MEGTVTSNSVWELSRASALPHHGFLWGRGSAFIPVWGRRTAVQDPVAEQSLFACATKLSA